MTNVLKKLMASCKRRLVEFLFKNRRIFFSIFVGVLSNSQFFEKRRNSDHKTVNIQIATVMIVFPSFLEAIWSFDNFET